MTLAGLLLALSAGLASAPFLEPIRLLPAAPFPLALLWFCARRHPLTGRLLLFATFWVFGISLYHLHLSLPNDSGQVGRLTGPSPVTVQGVVCSLAGRAGGGAVMDLEARRIVSGRIAARAEGGVRLFIGEGEPAARPGDLVRFRARLRRPRTFGTPGEFDYPRHLAYRDIQATAFLVRAQEVVLLAAPKKGGLASAVEGARIRIGRLIDRTVPEPAAPLVRALVIGDKSRVTDRQKDLLARGGLSHLFSISGLHLALVGGFLFILGRFLYRRSEALLLLSPPARLVPLLLLPALLGYLLLSGGALPTRRAFLMGAAGASLFWFGRRTAPLHLLAAAAFLWLCLDPMAFFEPAFQLSFAGVAGILILVPRWRAAVDKLPGPCRRPALLCLVTAAATVATTPLVLLHFHLLAPAGLLTNLIAVPAIGLAAVPLGLAGALVAPCWPAPAGWLFSGCGWIVQAVLEATAWILRLPLLHGWKLYLTPTQHLAVGLLLAALLVFGRRGKRWKSLPVLATLTALALLALPAPASPRLTVTALSVGQGDAILLSLPGGRHFLVDGGGLYGNRFDVGERLVAPALGRLGVRRLEAVVLTHDHPDHRQGLLHVLEHFPVSSFWSPGPVEGLFPALREVLARRRIPVRTFAPGWSALEKGEESELALYAPQGGGGNENERSLVLYVRQGEESLLLTGDLEAEGVAELIRASPPMRVSLLKLPHHGSRRSHPERLLDRFHPEICFVSAGRDNSYGFPSRVVVEELRRRGIPLRRTDLDGSLRFSTGGRGWRIQCWRNGLFH